MYIVAYSNLPPNIKQTQRTSHKSFISPSCTDLAELNTLTYYYADSVYSSNTCTVSKGNKGGMQKYLENALHGYNVNGNLYQPKPSPTIQSAWGTIPSFHKYHPLPACKSLWQEWKIISSSNLYHIKTAENRMLWYVTSKRKKTKPKLFCTDSHMENRRGSEMPSYL